MIRPVEWLGDRIRILDQTRLPGATVYLEFTDYREVVNAVRELKVRGAPAIGVAVAYGIALGARTLQPWMTAVPSGTCTIVRRPLV